MDSRATGRRCGRTPRVPMRATWRCPRSSRRRPASRVPVLGRPERRRLRPRTASWAWCGRRRRTGHRFLRGSRRDRRPLPDAGARRNRCRVLRRERPGRGPHQHRLRGGSDLPHHAGSRRCPGFGYVFEIDGGDGFVRYGAVRVTARGNDVPDLDWAFQTDPGNPELLVRSRQSYRPMRLAGSPPGVESGAPALRQLRAMPTPQLTLDGRSLTIDDVVRVAREPGVRVAARRRRARAP